MKITIVQGAFLPVPPIEGGAVEKLWYSMGKEFAKLGHEVTHISKRTPKLKNDEIVDNVSYIRIKGYTHTNNPIVHKFFDCLYSLRAFISISKSDIIITNTFFIPLFLSVFKKGHIYVSFERFPKKQAFLYRWSSRIRTPSNAVSNEIIKQTPAVRNLVKCIPNFLPEKYSKIETVLAEHKEKRFLYVGRIHPEKGIHLLVEAAKVLNIILDIVGPHEEHKGGGGEEYLKVLQEKAGDNITFIGSVFNDEELIKYYQNAYAFIYPSLAETGESFGLAPLEAMACGTIPVVSYLECFRDFIVDGKQGVFFNHRTDNQVDELVKAIQKVLLLSLVEITCMRKECFEQAQNYSVQNVAKQFVADFEGIING